MYQEELLVICCHQLLLELANDFKNVIGIKEAAGDIVQAMKLIQTKPEGF